MTEDVTQTDQMHEENLEDTVPVPLAETPLAPLEMSPASRVHHIGENKPQVAATMAVKEGLMGIGIGIMGMLTLACKTVAGVGEVAATTADAMSQKVDTGRVIIERAHENVKRKDPHQ